jgi:para-nitrobenzyl esterase
MKLQKRSAFILAMCLGAVLPGFAADHVKIANGTVEAAPPSASGVRIFRGIPFAQPPVGDLRWREPQPVKNWQGVRKAEKFGPHCMQRTGPTSDYWFRSEEMSEDCLYLNVWTPAKSAGEKLPVLVYVYGGGFQNGDGSEPRYDGESMASRGMVTVTMNYRLNIFGFFAHPELTKESKHHASGNYGLLDQVAALKWVQQNIAAFGGDPKHITIGGESAGSISVAALMASPLSRNVIAGAIGESGGIVSSLPMHTLSEAEQDGSKFADASGAASLKALRAMTAEQVQEAVTKVPGARFNTDVDGYFLPKSMPEIYAAGEQAKAPLLVGSNSEEQGAQSLLGSNEPTPENFAAAVRKTYGKQADEILKVIKPATADEVLDAATELASARFIAFGTWKWAFMQARNGGHPVYRYLYTHPRPAYLRAAGKNAEGRRPPRGAAHSAEIQYALGNIPIDPRYSWTPDDKTVSEKMQAYFANFIKTGNPNGAGLPNWPAYTEGTHYQIMRLDVDPQAMPEPHLDHYQVLDSGGTNP